MKKFYLLSFLVLSTFVSFSQDGTLDNSFNSQEQNIWPRKIIELPNGQILVSGEILNPSEIKAIKRLDTDGSIDNTFIATVFSNGGNYGEIEDFVVANNKILIGGDITNVNGLTVGNIALLNASDGSTDNTFNAGTGFNGLVNAVAVQSDGKFIIGGVFTTYDGISVSSIVRLNTNGTLDPTFSFSAGTTLGRTVNDLIVEPTGKVIVAANFSSPVKGLYRLNTNGSEDLSFNAGNIGVTGLNKGVNCILPTADGKYILGGNFEGYNGVTSKNIVKINSDGTIDNSFNAGLGFSSHVYSMDVQQDGKLIVGGLFNSFNGVSVNSLARINSNGSFDVSFNNNGAGLISPSTRVSAVKVIANGKILVGALAPSPFNGSSVNNVFRLNNASILPATGLSLTGKKAESFTTLNWQTISEHDTKQFEVETSNNATNFRKLNTVAASGSSNSLKEYKLVINNANLQVGEIYFRIKLVDNSGKIIYSNVIILEDKNSITFKLYPNPANQFTVLSFSQDVKEVAIVVFDIQGKKVFSNKINAVIGGQYRLSTSNLLAGTYIVNIKTDKGDLNERLVVYK